jgi:hypothetical protein
MLDIFCTTTEESRLSRNKKNLGEERAPFFFLSPQILVWLKPVETQALYHYILQYAYLLSQLLSPNFKKAI